MDRFKWQFRRKGALIEEKSYMKYTPLITDECNLSCRYCFQRYKDKGVMSKGILRTFLDNVFTIEVPKQLHKDVFIQFCGGEALLYPEVVDFGMNYIKQNCLPSCEKQVRINVLSNGTTLGNPNVREMLSRHPELDVSISLDGNREMQNLLRGGFDSIISNMQWYKERQKFPNMAMTVSTDNVKHLSSGFKFIVKELGVPEVWISIVMEDKKWEDDKYANILFAELKKIADFMTLPENAEEVWTNIFDMTQFQPSPGCLPICSAIPSQIVCTPIGQLYPCYVHRNPQITFDYSFGDVHNWIDTEKYAKLQTCTIENTVGLEMCVNCDIGFGCKRCSASFAELYGSMYKGDTSFCKAHHAKYHATQYLIEKRMEFIGLAPLSINRA